MVANILILGVKVPFTKGGAEILCTGLMQALRSRGHEVDMVDLPFSSVRKETILNQIALWRSLELREFSGKKVDLIIATKFPSYFANSRKKSLWLVHQHRPLYDLYGNWCGDFSDDPRDEALRRALVEADTRAISEFDFISCISDNVRQRLKNYNQISATTLYPPLPLGNRYRNATSEPYILSVGRICMIKRVDLMIKALPIIHNFVKLKVVGAPDERGIMDYFRNEIDKHHLWDRVEFLGRVDDENLLDLYSRALAVYYAPFNEDYGYVTLEGMASEKPIITAKDSGGVLEFVRDGETGLVLEPNSDSIGHGINRLVDDPVFTESLGKTGRKFIEDSGLLDRGWDHVVDGLLSPLTR